MMGEQSMSNLRESIAVKAFRSRLVRCKHVHASGRRCSQRVNRSTPDRLCGLHPILDINPEYTSCKECRSMMNAFTPPKGWPSIDR